MRSELLETIACLSSVTPVSDTCPSFSHQERSGLEVEISPTIPWMAEEARRTDELTIVERGQLFSDWSEKRRRLLQPSISRVHCRTVFNDGR